jgi:hypothetical protein
MDDRLRELYIDHVIELAEAGIIAHAFANAVEAGVPTDDAMAEVPRAAGNLPANIWPTSRGDVLPELRPAPPPPPPPIRLSPCDEGGRRPSRVRRHERR